MPAHLIYGLFNLNIFWDKVGQSLQYGIATLINTISTCIGIMYNVYYQLLQSRASLKVNSSDDVHMLCAHVV